MASESCQKILELTVHQLLANCPLPNSQLTDVQQLFDSPISREISWKLILANYLVTSYNDYSFCIKLIAESCVPVL